MVDDIPRWRADGHTHRSQPSEQLRQLWSNVVDDEKPWQHAQPVTVVLLWQRERLHCFFAWPACCSLFFHSSYKPFRYKLFLFQKKKKPLKPLTPLRFAHVPWTSWWLVITQTTSMKIFRCSRFSQFDSRIIENSLFEVLMMVFT